MTRSTTRMTALVSAAALFSALSAWAAKTNVNAAFTKNGGDLGSVDDWFACGVSVDPKNASNVQLQMGYNGTYYVKSDINFGSLLVDPWGSQITLDCLQGSTCPKIRLNNCSTSGTGSLLVNCSSSGYLTIRGGSWDLGGGKINFKPSSQSYENTALTFTDGAVVTNAGNIAFFRAPRQYLNVEGASALYAQSLYVGTSGVGCHMKVSGGSTFKVLDGQFDVPGAYAGGETYEGDGFCEFVATDTGTEVYGAGPNSGLKLEIGAGGVPGHLVVSNGAHFVSDYVENYLGTHTNAHLNLLRVADGGSMYMKNALYMSFKPFNGTGARWSESAQNASNRFEVVNGGVYTNAEVLSIAHVGNTFVVSNATAAIERLNVQGSDNFVILRGTTPSIRINPANHETYVKNKRTGQLGAMTSWFDGPTTLRFELPAEGYAADHVPFEVWRSFSLNPDARLEITGADAFMAAFEKGDVCRKTMTLIRCTDGPLTITSAQLAAAQATLPKGMKLKVQDNCLLLKAAHGGLTLLFR